MTHTTLLVDGHSLGWRAFAAQGMLSFQDVPTGMAFRFLVSLRRALDITGATRCRVVWDGGHTAFRTSIFPDYKKARSRPGPQEKEDPRPEFERQRAWLNDILPLLSVPHSVFPGWEADDVLGAAAAAWVYDQSRGNLVLLSGDRDLWHLIERNVKVLRPANKPGSGAELLTQENFQEETGFKSPVQWYWFRVLTGDTSDGVPGVGGVGEKRGRQMVEKGWPSTDPLCIKDYEAWMVEKRPLIHRNIELMNLWTAGVRFVKAFPDWESDSHWTPFQENGYKKARELLFKSGMLSLATNWVDWAKPFWRLVR